LLRLTEIIIPSSRLKLTVLIRLPKHYSLPGFMIIEKKTAEAQSTQRKELYRDHKFWFPGTDTGN